MKQNLIRMDTVDSTNLQVKRLASEGAPHGTVVIAEHQSAGKGSRGRQWESSEGSGIYMSILLRPELLPEQASMLTLVAAHSIWKVLYEEYRQEAKIKWPNDIVLNRKKLAGILTEMQADTSGIDHVVIGIGVNVNTRTFAPELSDKATSLYLENGFLFQKEKLAAQILNQLEKDYEDFIKAGDLSFMKKDYESALINIGELVRIEGNGEHWSGRALGITDKGQLRIQRQDGTVEEIYSGEVTVRGLYSYV